MAARGVESTEEAVAALNACDSLTARVLEHVRPVRFEVATSASEREAIFRLRYEVAVRDRLARPEELPDDGLERDSADDRAVLLGGWDGGTLASACRLVFPEGGRSLPIEDEFGVRFEPLGEVVEWTRMAVAQGYRDAEHLHFFALISASWLETRSRGYSVAAGAVSAAVLERYSDMGVNLSVVGRARRYWSERRYPVRFDVVSGNVPTEHWMPKVDAARAGRAANAAP